jgi:hypothetical protein
MFDRWCAFDSVADPGALVPPVPLQVVDVFDEKPNSSTRSSQLVAGARAFEAHSPTLENVYLLARKHL